MKIRKPAPALKLGFMRWRTRVKCLLAVMFIAAFAFTPGVRASNQWFVSTSGSPSGDGSSSNPWDLQTALNQPAAVLPGDTIWVRGGVYHAASSNGFNSLISGTAASPVVIRNYNNERAILDGIGDEFVIAVRGSYSWFWGLEITDSTTNRVPSSCDAILGYEPHPSAFGVGVYGPSNKFINMVVHDTAQGFSAYDESPDTEFTGNLSYYNGNLPYPSCPVTDRNHGHGMYLQNVTGLKTVNDNIIGDNADEGIQMYGGGGANVQGFRLNGNALYNTSSWPKQNYQFNVLIAGGAVRRDIQFQNNFSYFTPSLDSGVVSFGEYTDGQDMIVSNNTFVGGFTAVAVIKQAGPFTFTNNNVYADPSSVKEIDLEPDSGQTIASYTWDHNAYYGLNNFLYLQNRSFASWKSVTGFDANSTFNPSAPTGKWTSVRPNAYEAKRANIIIYNWDLSSAVNVDLSGVLALNDSYVVLDSQNFYGPPVAQGTYVGSSVSIPMLGLAKADPHGVSDPNGFATPAHTAPLFGTFIVMRTSSMPAPVSVSVTPPNTILKQSETQQFTATVQNTSDQRVTWSISPGVGTISNSGLYTAPAVMSSGQTITVTATSVADPSRSGSMTLTLKPPVAVSVAPTNWILGPNQTKQFIATVTSTNNTAVTWSINPVIGSIASDGSYTAPSPISATQTLTITATSVADPTKSGSTTVTLQPVGVAIAPASITLFAGDTQQFTPTVTGADNTAVTWTLNPPGTGTLSNTGLYTAPAPISATQVVSVTATSISDNSKSATATITLSPPVTPSFLQPIPDVTALFGQTVTLNVLATGGGLSYQWQSQAPGAGSFSPIPGATSSSYTTAPVTLADSGTQFRCVITNSIGTATSNASNLVVILGVNYVGATTLGTLRNNFSGWIGAALAVGPNQITVTSLGRIFAPGNSGTHIVKLVNATTGADVPGGSVAIPMIGGTPGAFTYNNLPSLITLSPNTTYFLLSQEVSGGDQWYDWDTTVQTSSVATAIGPAYGTPYASSLATNRMYGPLDMRYSAYVSVSPAGTTVYGGQSQQFTVTITGTSNNAVTWSLNPAVGSLSSSGLYTAPAIINSTQTVSVTATSVADPSRSATAIVTLSPPITVSVDPPSVTLGHGQTQQFTASVQNTPNPNVLWSVNPPVGSITAAGLYTAPNSITSPQSITVVATSQADGTTAGTATVSLTPPVPVILSPLSSSLGISQTQQFTVNQPVSWSLSPAVGGISSGGLYTAPAVIATGQILTVTATSIADGTQFANASITLVPPTPVSISQHPQNQIATVGQPVTFTVVAAGSQISYQWQSMPAGAGSFSPIAGATSSSYTLNSPAVSDHGTQYRCVVSNSISAATSNAAMLSVLPAGVNFVQSVTNGSLRNNYSGWVGMKVTVGATPISVGALGRIYISGNHGNHTLKLVDAATGVDVPGGSTTVNLSLGTTPGTFLYAPLPSNVTLPPNHSYYVVSIEGEFGDQWYDLNTQVQTSAVATVNSAVYGAPYAVTAGLNNSYVPVDFLYIVPVTVTINPTSVQLNVSQTQQFTTTVVGTGNTAVTWTVTPSAGSVSAGLYTAPASISATQTVTVTATSVADPSQSASATVTLQPVAVAMTPASASLFASQTQQFSSTVTGTSNTGLNWTINPPGAGSISPAGLYTAPASIASLQTITVTATSVVDNSKLASATVTLQPPPPPAITTQPQSASVLTGQAAVFAVTATGAVSYQWQSKAPGAGSFSSIAGATSSTYTTPPAIAGDDGTQFLCVVSNAAGPTTSNIAVLSVIAGTGYVVSTPTLGTVRHDYSGWIGASISVGSSPVTVSALGRLFLTGNSQTHILRLVTTAGADVAGGTVSVSMLGGTPGTFVYGVLPTPVTLSANTTYYVLTQETSNGDLWYDFAGTTVQTTSVASTLGAVYGTGAPYIAINSANHMFVPVSFLYVSSSPSVGVTVNPSSASLSASQTQQFTATVTGSANTSVTWSLNPNVGGISSSGLYTAPPSIAASQTITVTATSAADNSKSASATVTLVPVSVSLAPATSSLSGGQTQQFTPTVTGTNNTSVNWTINPSNAGSISATGLYTAPASIASVQTVTVTAASAADNTKFGTATVTLNPPAAPAITQQPQGVSVVTGQPAGFSVTATGSGLTYQWQSMASGAGSFSNIGGATSASYTAPALTLADSGTQFRVVVTNPSGSVTSNAATLTVLTAGTSFVTASTPGTLRSDYTGWVGMKVTVGSLPITVSSIGRLVVLNNASAHTLKIVDAATGNDLAVTSVNTNGVTAGTIVYGAVTPVTLSANGVYYILSQETAGAFADQWYELNSLVQTTAAGVVNGPVYGIPFVPVAGMPGHTYVILDFKYTPSGSGPISVAVTPTTASLNGGQTQPFTATVTGDPNTSVTWSLNPNVGSVSNAGLYTAPSVIGSSQTVTVTATSVADNTKSASATVTLVPVSISLAPGSSTLSGGQTQQFTPTVTGTNNTSVNWTINPSNVGSISSSGFYTAPASIASTQTVTVTATSAADNTKLATATVTLNPPALPVITQQPQNATVNAGQTATFSVTATGGVTYQWQSKSSGAGSFTPIGGATAASYTTPATALADDGKQFRCIVANNQGSATSTAATLNVPATQSVPTKNFVVSTALGTLRNNFAGWVGMSVTIGGSSLTVEQLGRVFAPGNAGTHTVKIVNAATGADVTGGSVAISMSGGTPGSFVYGALAAPVVLSSGATYYILSQETLGGDQWYDYNTTATTNWEATLSASVYGTGAPYVAIGGSVGHMYVPVDFKYDVPVAAFVSSFTLGTTRNDYTGWVGMGFTVGSSSLTVSSLGRFVTAGDSASHIVKLVDAATGLDVAGGSVTVNAAGATAGAFTYTALSSPVVLSANGAYFIVSQETAGGDHWYDWDTKVQSPPVGTVTRAVYGSGSSFTVVQSSAGRSYVPLNFQFQ